VPISTGTIPQYQTPPGAEKFPLSQVEHLNRSGKAATPGAAFVGQTIVFGRLPAAPLKKRRLAAWQTTNNHGLPSRGFDRPQNG
jgi:hypothetical protein